MPRSAAPEIWRSFAIDALPGSEYSGRGTLLSKLDSGPNETTAGVLFLTLRSDGYDLFAQPDGAFYRLSRRPDQSDCGQTRAERYDQYCPRSRRSPRHGA
jgi:hypothetical protein